MEGAAEEPVGRQQFLPGKAGRSLTLYCMGVFDNLRPNLGFQRSRNGGATLAVAAR